MKKVVWTLGMLVLTSGMASAQDTNELVPTAPVLYEEPQTSALDRAIIANERKLMDDVAKKDKAGFTAMVDAGRRRARRDDGRDEDVGLRGEARSSERDGLADQRRKGPAGSTRTPPWSATSGPAPAPSRARSSRHRSGLRPCGRRRATSGSPRKSSKPRPQSDSWLMPQGSWKSISPEP